MVRIAVLRSSDAICEEGNEGVLWSEVMEEEVILWNVWLSDLGAIEYFPLSKGTSRNGTSENEMYFVEKWKLRLNNCIFEIDGIYFFSYTKD